MAAVCARDQGKVADAVEQQNNRNTDFEFVQAIDAYLPHAVSDIPMARGQLIKVVQWHIPNDPAFAEGEIIVSSHFPLSQSWSSNSSVASKKMAVRGRFPKALVIPYRKSILTLDNRIKRLSVVEGMPSSHLKMTGRLRSKTAEPDREVGEKSRNSSFVPREISSHPEHSDSRNRTRHASLPDKPRWNKIGNVTHLELLGWENFKDIITGDKVPMFAIRIYSPPHTHIIFRRYSDIKDLHLALQSERLSQTTYNSSSPLTAPSSPFLSSRMLPPNSDVETASSSLLVTGVSASVGNLISLSKTPVKMPSLPAERELSRGVAGYIKEKSKKLLRDYLEILLQPVLVSAVATQEFFTPTARDVSLTSRSKLVKKFIGKSKLNTKSKGKKAKARGLKKLFFFELYNSPSELKSSARGSSFESISSSSSISSFCSSSADEFEETRPPTSPCEVKPTGNMEIFDDVDSYALEVVPIQEIIGCYAADTFSLPDSLPVKEPPTASYVASPEMDTLLDAKSPSRKLTLAEKFKAGKLMAYKKSSVDMLDYSFDSSAGPFAVGRKLDLLTLPEAAKVIGKEKRNGVDYFSIHVIMRLMRPNKSSCGDSRSSDEYHVYRTLDNISSFCDVISSLLTIYLRCPDGKPSDWRKQVGVEQFFKEELLLDLEGLQKQLKKVVKVEEMDELMKELTSKRLTKKLKLMHHRSQNPLPNETSPLHTVHVADTEGGGDSTGRVAAAERRQREQQLWNAAKMFWRQSLDDQVWESGLGPQVKK